MSLPSTIGTADRSLVAQIFDHLRDEIMSGTLAPGEKLREQWLADRLTVSRIPLREAIRMLEAEGFIHSIPRRGSYVTRLTVQDVHDLFDLRESLEVLAARRAAARAKTADPALVGAIRESLTRNKEAVAAGEPRAIAASSAEFHNLVVELSGNNLLATLMRPVSGRVEWLFRLTSQRDQKAACRAHDKLLRAILRGDVDDAATIALDHIASGREPSVGILSAVLPAD